MTDYTKLVKALRYCGKKYFTGDECKNCSLFGTGPLCSDKLKLDAAAAIEALQAKQKKTVTQIFGEEQMAWEGRCKDLMYQIADLQAQLPKRGEWVEVETAWRCSICEAESPHTYPICPYCGSIMRTSLYDSEK